MTEAGEVAPTGGVELDRPGFMLRFDNDSPLAGAVVRCRRATAGGCIDLVVGHAFAQVTPDQLPALAAAAAAGDVAKADGLYRMFRACAGALVGWNLTDQGRPVPADLDGLLGLELEHAVAVTQAWLEHAAAADREQRATEAVLDLPMTPVAG